MADYGLIRLHGEIAHARGESKNPYPHGGSYAAAWQAGFDAAAFDRAATEQADRSTITAKGPDKCP
jgi:hypothetical protein